MTNEELLNNLIEHCQVTSRHRGLFIRDRKEHPELEKLLAGKRKVLARLARSIVDAWVEENSGAKQGKRIDCSLG
jgi:hypothetical protein